MPTPFAALETRVHRAVASHLANAELVCGGLSIPVVFGDIEDHGEAIGSGPGSGPPRNFREWQAGAAAADLAGLVAVDAPCSIRGVGYVVTRSVTDPRGWTTLTLRRA